MAGAKVRGTDKVLATLNREINKIGGGTRKGLLEGAIIIQGEAMEITPHDKGVLVNSAFHDSEMTLKGPRARVGYTAEYAAFAHEMPADTNWSKPDTGNKFLEKAVRRSIRQVFGAILRHAKVRG